MSGVSIELTDSGGQSWVLRLGQSFEIGRSPKTAVHLRGDSQISRRHALIELRKTGLFLTDLGSQNGTFVDGERLIPNLATDISAARRVHVGEHELSLRRMGEFDDDLETRAVGMQPVPEVEFTILGKIAEGATGVIYAAEQLLLRRRVAIKVLREEFSRDKATRERFLRQGWLFSEIESPYVVDIYDVRTDLHRVSLIMELIEGPSAEDRLKAGPLPMNEALRIGEDIGRALHAMAEAGVVHRSIRPSAILLDPSGIAKLSGFGNAKAIVVPTDMATPLREMFGTAAYAAPELAEAARATLAADVYSLGATLHHLCCGGGASTKDYEGELQPLSRCGLANPPPAELEELLGAMLRPKPGDRPRVDSLADLFRSVRLRHYRPDQASTRAMADDTVHRRRSKL